MRSRWAFLQMGLVAFGFHFAAIIAVVASGNWTGDPHPILQKLTPLWVAYGKANALLPDSWFHSMKNGSAWHDAMNLAVWAGLQWLVPTFVLDLVRQRSN